MLAPLAYVCFDHHDCAGDDCAVCELFEVVRAVKGKPASTPVPMSAQLVRKVLPAAAPLGLLAWILCAETPVSRRELLVI